MLSAYRRFKKNTPLRKYTSTRMVTTIKAAEQSVFGLLRKLTPVSEQSRFDAICHVGLQKTGTVWFREMLSDLEVFKHTGLHFRDCAGITLPHQGHLDGIYSPIRQFDEQIQTRLSEESVATIAVIRDPVSLVLSWIKSTSKYHVSRKGGALEQRRAELLQLGQEDQIDYAIEFLHSKNRFDQFERLIDFANQSPSRVLVKYEDCLFRPQETFARIFETCDIRMTEHAVAAFLERHSFQSYSGRKITEQAASTSSLQGRTHIEAEALDPALIAKVMNAVGENWSRLYAR